MSALSIARGDTKTIIETVTGLGANGLAGCSFWLTAKWDPGDPDWKAVFQKGPGSWQVTTVGNAITAGIAICQLDPPDTAALPGHQCLLVYDVQMRDLAGNLFTVDEGTLTVFPDVTVAQTPSGGRNVPTSAATAGL